MGVQQSQLLLELVQARHDDQGEVEQIVLCKTWWDWPEANRMCGQELPGGLFWRLSPYQGAFSLWRHVRIDEYEPVVRVELKGGFKHAVR